MTSAPLLLPPLADPDLFVKTMGKLHRRLVDDLRERAADPRIEPSLREAWNADKKQGRAGEPYEVYRDAFCDQAGASWILCTIFARTLEDRGYLPHRLAGPGAVERWTTFRSVYKFLGERDYLLHIFDGISLLPSAKEVFGPGFAALWRLGPTHRALGELLDELRVEENGRLRFTFGKTDDPRDGAGSSTRYLGDLYQNLNEDVRKRYALLQTPDFVERFLLDNTLDPAIRERGCAVTVLDPACGSGHLILGAYDRLFAAWRRDEPGREKHEVAKLALGQVYGIDLNPYAAAVARFRLLLSYLDKAGVTSLQHAPEKLPLLIYVGDSLLAGRRELQAGLGDLFGDVAGLDQSPLFSLFNSEADQLLHKKRFDVIVANPPYITEKDAAKRELIRKQYKAAYNQYALSAPFAERIFQLGNAGAYTGQITANSFMKREFGKALVEQVLKDWDLTHVIDTSGAFIPGHGTPTVILFGRSQKPTNPNVRVVMGIRGEPTTPEDPAQGKVWSSIVEHHQGFGAQDAEGDPKPQMFKGDIAFENEFISVTEVAREKLSKHPWNMSGGGAAELKDSLESRANKRLDDLIESIGRTTVVGEDDIWISEPGHWARVGLQQHAVPLIIGEVVRDWTLTDAPEVLYPYVTLGGATLPANHLAVQVLWPWRTLLANRTVFGKQMKAHGRPWWEHLEHYTSKLRTPLSITYAEVATHNHFVLDHGGKVFKQTAPVIKLSEKATEDEHLALLGYLNSSTACFYLRQVATQKQMMGGESVRHSHKYRVTYAFNGQNVGQIPVPPQGPYDARMLELTKCMDAWVHALAQCELLEVVQHGEWSDAETLRVRIAEAQRKYDEIRRQMVGAQEELDWLAYAAFGLVEKEYVLLSGDVPHISPGQRPFEQLLGMDISFDGFPISIPTLEPRHKALFDARLKLLAAGNSEVRLIEAPEFKRRWIGQQGKFNSQRRDRQEKLQAAGESFLLTRAESLFKNRDPRPLSILAIAAELHRDPKIRAVAEVLTGSATVELESLLADLLQRDAVPSATCQVYSDEGIETRRIWERTWELQRLEDACQKIEIEPPPRYDPKDFENAAILWRLRGKLDVPKERFISYPTATPPPGASRKPGLVFGWAGWDALQKLQAVIELWQQEMGLHGHDLLPRATREPIAEADPGDERLARDRALRLKLMPMLQTMVDLLPWVKQGHDEDGQTARAFAAYIAEESRKLEVTLDEAHGYRRPAKVTQPKARRAATAKRSPRKNA